MAAEPFIFHRRVAFGDCDPARIYYTPRAIDYAVEAVEAWFETTLEVTWARLAQESGLDIRFTQAGCEYLRPLVAGQVAHLRVLAANLDTTHITFGVTAEDGNGATSFRARLVACLVNRSANVPVPIPAEYLARIEPSQDQSAVKTEAVPPLPSYDKTSSPGLFTRQRRVLYGECGISGTVYAPRVFNYAAEAVEEWFEEILELPWLELVTTRRQGAPFVSATCDYLLPMTLGQTLTFAVWVTKMGEKSLQFAVAGYQENGEPCFDAQLVACFIDQNGFRSTQIPGEYRNRIAEYQAACNR